MFNLSWYEVRVYKKEEHELLPGQFFSDEPGVYIEGQFGIRLETVLRWQSVHTMSLIVVFTWFLPDPGDGDPRRHLFSWDAIDSTCRVEEKKQFPNSEFDFGPFLHFQPVCLVPFEPKLIQYNLLSRWPFKARIFLKSIFRAQVNWLNRYNQLIKEKVWPKYQIQSKNFLFLLRT